jgi:hypothetical protein
MEDHERASRTEGPGIPRHLAALASAAFVLKIAIALCTYGSTDALIYEADLMKIRQDGAVALYRDGISTEWCGQAGQRSCPPFIHPPFIVHALEGWGALADISGLPLRFWLRFTCAVADAGSLVLLLRMLARRRDWQTQIALALFAVSPISILVSGFHANTDPILIFFVLAAIYLIESRRPAWFAGAALGMAMSVKIVPVLLVPAALLALPGTRRRIGLLVGAGAVALAGSLPVLLVAPELVITRVGGYGSQSGPWGLSLLALASLHSPHLAWLHDLHAAYGKILSVGLVLAASWWPRPHFLPHALLLRVGFLMFLFLSLAPGFGVQYLAWLVPWVVALGVWATLIYYLAGGLFLCAYYTPAAGGVPWDLVNTLGRPAWTPTVLGLGLICWVVVCAITLGYVRALRVTRAEGG